MAEMIAGAATGVMGSITRKLTALLGDKYQLARNVKHGIRFLRDELSTMEAVLLRLEGRNDDHLDPVVKDWRSKVHELSLDIEDCIDRFTLNHSLSHGGSKANFVRDAVRKVKTLFKDGGIAKEIQELKRLVDEQSERGKRYHDINQCLTATPQPEPLNPRSLALFQEARDLVGIDAPREEIIQLLKCEDKDQDKVVSIYGIGGQGKTTLAMEVYHKITEAFDCRAFVTVSLSPDIKKILRDILYHINKAEFNRSERLETKQLIDTVRECLKDKRYFVLIDDIWKEDAWEVVRRALPVNDNGSRIITTTRNKEVAKSCCTGIAAQMYEAKPLSADDSQRLFFKRLFCSSEDCPQELREVSSDILRKCGGLPLAILSIAGLLANRSPMVDVWVNVLKSIAAAVDKDDKMKRILLLSYFDLPHRLKSCLLYLSVFAEDYSIDCQQLILLWVAEGLIPGHDRQSMEQLGRNYLNQLINRSLVQPTDIGIDDTTVENCRVHDVILEFIMSKGVEENFVTIWNGNGLSKNYPSNKIRRLSIQKDISAPAEEIAKTIKNAAHIRSINIFGSNSLLVNNHASELLNSQVLRVLNIQCEAKECSLGHVKSCGQLKYLRADLELPEDIVKLQHLETLNVRSVSLKSLPRSSIHLQKLVRLVVYQTLRLPEGIENLQMLEELSTINLGVQSVKFIQGLGDLINLRVLKTIWSYYNTELPDMQCHKKACISSLSKLFTHLRELHVWDYHDSAPSFMTSCVPTPLPLRELVLGRGTHNLSVGPQINSLVDLTRLHIVVHDEAGKEGINILASLPMLLILTVIFDVKGDSELCPRHAINGQGFQVLVKFNLFCYRDLALEFGPGAMPKLQRLKIYLMARCQFKCGEGGLVLGLHNLPGLKHLAIDINCDAAFADEVEALEDDIRGAAAVHPNRPILEVDRICQDWIAQGSSRRPSDHPIPRPNPSIWIKSELNFAFQIRRIHT